MRIEPGSGGKPVLRGDRPWAFNLSHSGHLAVVAVTRRPAVGVDVELLGRDVRPAVVRRALAPSELALVEGVAPERRAEAFLRHWTAKEAYGKALGAGLAVGMAEVVVAGVLDGEPRLVGIDGWSVQGFDPEPRAVGAVVAAGGPWRARVRGAV